MRIEKYKQVASIWQDYSDGLRYYLLKKTKDEDIARDLSHEVLMKIYNTCCTGRDIRNIKSWLFQTAHNTAIDFLKYNQRLSNELGDIAEELEPHHWKEMGEFIEPLINFLPEKYATPLRLSDLEGMRHQLIADKLDLSLTATKSRIFRARNMLKKEILACFHVEKNSCGCIVGFELRSACTPLQQLKKNI